MLRRASRRASEAGSDGSQRPPATSRATSRRAIARRAARSVDSSSAGARPAITAAQGTSRRARRTLSQVRPPATDDAALDASGADRLDQLVGDRPGQRLPRPGPSPRAKVRAPPQQRAEQRFAAKAAVEVGEVVVHAEGEAHPLDRDLELPAIGPGARRGGAVQVRSGDRGGLQRLGTEADRPRAGLPGVDGDRRPGDVEETGSDAPRAPQDAVAARGGQAEGRGRAHLDLEAGAPGRAHRPSR